MLPEVIEAIALLEKAIDGKDYDPLLVTRAKSVLEKGLTNCSEDTVSEIMKILRAAATPKERLVMAVEGNREEVAAYLKKSTKTLSRYLSEDVLNEKLTKDQKEFIIKKWG